MTAIQNREMSSLTSMSLGLAGSESLSCIGIFGGETADCSDRSKDWPPSGGENLA